LGWFRARCAESFSPVLPGDSIGENMTLGNSGVMTFAVIEDGSLSGMRI
jgi:hypothetical protein